MTGTEIRLLGPVGVWHGTRLLGPTTAQQRCVLAMLALEVGRLVPVDRLELALWRDSPPASARNAVQGNVAGLRRLLAEVGGAGITTSSGGYLLAADPDLIDLHRFRSLVDRARGAGPAEAYELLGAALAVWRGPVLADVAGDWLPASVGPGLAEERFAALEARIDHALRLELHNEVVTELSPLVAQNPFRERLAWQLMTALQGCGRRADALEVFRTVRQRFVTELGIEPGPDLRRAQWLALRGQAEPAPPREVVHRPEPPRQLPADVVPFVGRVEQLALLDSMITPTGPEPFRTAGIAAINGTAGVGKTALAVHWAHRVCGHFPDGQLYVNLRGFDPGEAMGPATAIRGFLDALHVPAGRLPADPQAQAGLYRSLLATRRMLVVLDNARDAEQVRPLLPGAASLTIVTSRNPLLSLIAIEGARPVGVALFTEEEAGELLSGRLSGERVAGEPKAAGEIVARCARLPLALAIAAARAAAHPAFPLSALAAELREASGGLARFTAGDPATDLRAVLSWSYRTLSEPAARLFRLLGLHPGPEVGVAAAASLAGAARPHTEILLRELADAHLVTEQAPGRFTRHDLLRAYASELVGAAETEAQRLAAVHRLLDHQLHSGQAAAALVNPNRDPIHTDDPVSGVEPEGFADAEQAQSWYAREGACLFASAGLAERFGFDGHVWRLAWTLEEAYLRSGRWDDLAAAHATALRAAVRLDNQVARMQAHQGLARAHAALADYDRARQHLRQALRLCAETGDRAGQARAHLGLGWTYDRQGRYTATLRHAGRARDLYRALDHQVGYARALNCVGWSQARLARYDEALANCRRAVAMLREARDQIGEANAWDSIGFIHHRLGDHRRAVSCYEQAVSGHRRLRDRSATAATLARLGDTHLATGDHRSARRAWRHALSIMTELGHAEAAVLRVRMDGLYGRVGESPHET
ncbi:BTAD domain-containing putative transcriptional regulator [Dactylosporangium sp. NPDC005572]|uniref:AfsR/SARP family transcriptional regulator n=1 Tax=Dactylosporangium sp. NPDC005572 TaxID=3156889 RepID=UPI0033A26F92